MTELNDFLFRGTLADLDPDVAALVQHETDRQARTLIMIPSESTVPQAVREAVGSAFHNIYAEGYPPDAMRALSEADLLDYEARLVDYRRNGDARYYKGTEYANLVESLARLRVAQAFATPNAPADKLFVNVQPLSGAPANSAVYTALLQPGDTLMGLDLLHGGHLTHGSPVARSGLFYNAVAYSVDATTERLDYDAIGALARAHRPKIIVAGYTSYPFAPDWMAFRDIADSVGAVLLADIAHVAGLVLAGAYPSPVGIADVVNFTTHKTLGGPRGAVSITHRADLAKKIDRGVFPGEQGGPHVNSIAGLAVAMKLAQTPQFHALQHQTVQNAARLSQRLQARGLRVAYGGTDTHMLVFDTQSVTGVDGTRLTGDMAARLLDLVGIVANRNTIPGDKSALRAYGVRLGTPWITQRGLNEADIDVLGDTIADLLLATVPFTYPGRKPQARAKVAFDVLQDARRVVAGLVAKAGIDTDARLAAYPHAEDALDELLDGDWRAFRVHGEHAGAFLDAALTGDVLGVTPGATAPSYALDASGTPIARVLVSAQPDGFRLAAQGLTGRLLAWLRALSDGFVIVDPTDITAKLPGPVVVRDHGVLAEGAVALDAWDDARAVLHKPYFVGVHGEQFQWPDATPQPLPVFTYDAPPVDGLRRTPLYDTHVALGAKLVDFAGYEMPVWYSSVAAEHAAVRQGAGLFDVAHMGVYEACGPGALPFLNTVFTNDLTKLAVGTSQYGFLLGVDGTPYDDLLVYRLADDHFLLVVNASNDAQNWAWLQAVQAGHTQIDPRDPGRTLAGLPPFTLRNLRDAGAGDDQRVDLALQGPRSMDVLTTLGHADPGDLAAVRALPWAGVTRATLGGYDLVVSRTGYTGERMGFELFVHPARAATLFEALVQAGATPCGLAARDSLRTEAGLPLYGHELSGPLGVTPGEAGLSDYVKLWKPFFVGKQAFLAREAQRDSTVVRFRLESRGARPPHQGDPVVDKRGRVVGHVTSCALDAEGYQLGMARVQHAVATEGTPISVFIGVGRANGRTPHEGQANVGARLPVPEPAVVLSRFPARAKA